MSGAAALAQPHSGAIAGANAKLLELRGLDKRFGATHALKSLDLAFVEGEVHAIVGENGAGKSTLIKLLTGVHVPSSGAIVWRGQRVAIDTPHDALAMGINAVHQEVVLCGALTVAANLFLGDEATRHGLLQHRTMIRAAQAILDEIGFHIRADAMLSSLTIGQQQLVATARAATRGTQFLIFDEPTAYLTRQESIQLFALIRRLKARGVTIVYISHRLEEVFDLADRVSVLRDGALVLTSAIADTDEQALIRAMINRSIEQVFHKAVCQPGPVILATRALCGPMSERGPRPSPPYAPTSTSPTAHIRGNASTCSGRRRAGASSPISTRATGSHATRRSSASWQLPSWRLASAWP